MAQLSATHLVLSLTFLLSCLSAIATSSTIEQQLEELKENYENRLNVLEQQNVEKQDILESKINRLEAEVEEMERMEEKQELLRFEATE
uniref:Uncharacterized protein n=1 Tax=Daphnia galeata TaxID=27404 RepID=A0A8J2RT74_9CRUS|nr:unnamed protein product [Daphnia galeata]